MNLLLVLSFLALCSSSQARDEPEQLPKTEKITINDARDKRQLSNFNNDYKDLIQRRITSNYGPHIESSPGYPNPYDLGYQKVPNFGPPYSVQQNQYGIQQQGYIEAPEPIIEIIIKESNDTILRTPEPVKLHPQKKKKEQVQVFYVKYNKDEKKGLIIDDPIPALTPTHFNREESEEQEYEDVKEPINLLPVQSTTLRTIIKPDSETFHSDSGIHVTFNTESKDQSGHEFQEDYGESAVRPIISEPNNPNSEPSHAIGQLNQSPLNYQLNSNDRARAFDIQHKNNVQNPSPLPVAQQNYHRFAPVPHLNSPQFSRPTSDQGLLLSYTQNQANRFLQAQNFDSRIKNIAPANVQNNQQNLRFPEPQTLNFAPPTNVAPVKFRQQPPNHQPKPIPIPLRYSEQAPQSTGGQPQYVNHHYKHFNQLRPKTPNFPFPQNPQFSQSISPNRLPNQQQSLVHEQSNIRLPVATRTPPPSAPLIHQLEHNQKVKLSAPEANPAIYEHGSFLAPQNSAVNPSNQPHFAGNTQDFNHLVSGAELVESLSKFEQHITETVPLSEINKPFSPFRQLASLQSTVAQHNPALPQAHELHYNPATQKNQHDESLISQSLAHAKLLHQQQQQLRQTEAFNAEPSNTNSLSPQIVFPVNYHNKNEHLHEKPSPSVNTVQSNRAVVPVFREKVIPGKGVSNLATDVFADLNSQEQSFNGNAPSHHPLISNSVTSTERNFVTNYVSSTSRKPPQSPSTTARPAVEKKVTPALPDEVPDDLRQQLLSSGILDNADISVLDYDKVGDIPLENLPPEHLANFYGAGGGTQISSSNRVLNIVKPNGEKVSQLKYPRIDESQEKHHKVLPEKHNVNLKVVRFDSTNQKSVADQYIKANSTVLPSVDINHNYNRYLPLKVDGEQFPIPDVETLRNKKISSVVVLAPVDGLSTSDAYDDDDVIEDGRYERDVLDSKEVRFIAGDSLKNILHKPTKENFKRWLDKESRTDVDLQSVVLLVAKGSRGQEIYMYDIPSKTVTRLKGELSTAFVNVAESNANAQDVDVNNIRLTDSGIYEKMPALDSDKEKITIIRAQTPVHAIQRRYSVIR